MARRSTLGPLAVAILTLPALTRAGTTLPTTYPTTLPVDAVTALVDQLASDNAATVAEAQNRLAALGTGALAALQQRSAVLQAAADTLTGIDQKAILTGTPITFSASALSLSQAVKELARQGNAALIADVKDAETVQVQVIQGETFFAVLDHLRKQAGLRLLTNGEGFSLRPKVTPPDRSTSRATTRSATRPGVRRNGALPDPLVSINGSTMVLLNSATHPVLNGVAQAGVLSSRLTLIVEPKVHILGWAYRSSLTHATDEQGNVLKAPDSPGRQIMGVDGSQQSFTSELQVTSVDGGPVHGIGRVTGSIRALVGLRPQNVDLSTLLRGESVNVPLADGNSASFSGFRRVDNNRFQMQFSLPRDVIGFSDNEPAPMITGTGPNGLRYHAHRSSWSLNDRIQSGSIELTTSGTAQVAPPTTLTLLVYDQHAFIDIPFEFENVTLP